MIIVVPFTKYGVPENGLSPTIRIMDAETGGVIQTGTMFLLQNGFYKYDFSGYNEKKQYAIAIDGGSSLPNGERYKFAGNENYIEDIESVVTASVKVIDKGPPTAVF